MQGRFSLAQIMEEGQAARQEDFIVLLRVPFYGCKQFIHDLDPSRSRVDACKRRVSERLCQVESVFIVSVYVREVGNKGEEGHQHENSTGMGKHCGKLEGTYATMNLFCMEYCQRKHQPHAVKELIQPWCRSQRGDDHDDESGGHEPGDPVVPFTVDTEGQQRKHRHASCRCHDDPVYDLVHVPDLHAEICGGDEGETDDQDIGKCTTALPADDGDHIQTEHAVRGQSEHDLCLVPVHGQ
ncbi:MAG: hypothetical protein BWX71_02618 [Deltaproteobacteria bacterium ADurb.Bin072]|nr:MAG: hypothetical protein BWX71_02618 [Deltaproteobacteria bacterium ADurb.Bin072]